MLRSYRSKLPDHHKSILTGMASVVVFIAIAKAAGALKEIALAWRYGVGAEIDAYMLVFTLVNWPTSVWLGVLPALVIPLEAKIRATTPAELTRFRAELLGLTAAIGILLVALYLVVLPWCFRLGFFGLPAHTSELAAAMMRVMAWTVLPGLMGALYATWTMSGGRHANTLLEGVPAVCILAAVLFWSGSGTLAWGTLAGVIAQTACLVAYVGRTYTPPRSFTSSGWRKFLPSLRIVLIGQAVMSMTALADQAFAAGLTEGSISSLGYSGRILGLLIGLGATAVWRATLPVFSKADVGGAVDVRREAKRWAGVMGFCGIVVAAVGWFAAPWVVRVLFYRGTFSANDVVNVTHLLRLGLLQLPIYFASLVLVSMHSALGHYRLLSLSGFLGLGVKLIVAWLMVKSSGVNGLVVSQAVVYAATTAFLLWGGGRRSSAGHRHYP